MTNAIQVPEQVKADQRAASDPGGSAWLRANAGSGKTYVLAQRVLRLLLAGTEPSRILCITYTKAAAAEMANRVFGWLGQWATLPEDGLVDELRQLQGRAPSDAERLRARRLFAAAIETPGRLRVQTIHAFCERLLQQFPFEASVTAGFSVLDERAAAELLAEARAEVLQAVAGSEAHLSPHLERLAAEAGDEALAAVLRAVVGHRNELKSWLGRAQDLDGVVADLRSSLGLAEGEDEQAIVNEILNGDILARSEWQAVAEVLAGGGANDRAAAKRLQAAFEADSADGLDDYLLVFFKKDGDLRKAVATRAICDADPDLAERFSREQVRLDSLCDKLKAARIAAATEALLRIGDAVIGRYERLKGGRGLLDYDDLIDRAASLLTRADAAWVLYKLDGGLDHVLVDEAQDTSPRQWQVVASIVEEFFAGRSARESTRTLFAVGDEKQSIYSFQGAEPRRFAEMRSAFRRAVEASGQPFSEVGLKLSFRSTPAVLQAVDATFAEPPAKDGLSYDDDAEPILHHAVRLRDAGRVELWPVIEPDPRDPPPPWDAPFDVERPADPAARLAERIALTIRGWLDTSERLEATGKPITAGDVMILVRNRHPFVEPMIRALKAQNIPVAGADRLVLTEHIAVMDLMALGRFCLMPEDDLNLAALLKSPLAGLSEDDLMGLAIGRGGSLWDSLRASRDHALVAERLTAWRGRAGFERPYEFYARILGAERMREAFHRRLGTEAFEALDEFLSLSLAYEQSATPTLAGFLHWLAAAPSEVKRDMEKGRDEVRVMTVHGAKGLEAPVVFLPDTVRAVDARRAGPIFRIGEEGEGAGFVWAPRKRDDCAVTRRLRERTVARQRDEEHRLLYVAMTRACDRLYVAGCQNGASRPEGCWYQLVCEALEPHLEPFTGRDGEPVLRLSSPLPPRPAVKAEAPAPSEPPPTWLVMDAPYEAAVQRAAPSQLADSTTDPATPQPGGLGRRREARRRGQVIHRLLELLPEVAPERRREAAERAIGALAPEWDRPTVESALAEVDAVIEDAAFAAAFQPGSRPEVSIAGRVTGIDRPMVGQIDRLWIGESAALIVDYKTDRTVPKSPLDVGPAYLAQLGAYCGLLAKLYPNRQMRAAIVWTAAPLLMELPADLLAMHGGPSLP